MLPARATRREPGCYAALVHVVSTSSLPIDLDGADHGRVSGGDRLRCRRAGTSGSWALDLTEADALVCLLLDRIDEALLERAPKLRVVANCAVGVDNIDLAAATRRAGSR